MSSLSYKLAFFLKWCKILIFKSTDQKFSKIRFDFCIRGNYWFLYWHHQSHGAQVHGVWPTSGYSMGLSTISVGLTLIQQLFMKPLKFSGHCPRQQGDIMVRKNRHGPCLYDAYNLAKETITLINAQLLTELSVWREGTCPWELRDGGGGRDSKELQLLQDHMSSATMSSTTSRVSRLLPPVMHLQQPCDNAKMYNPLSPSPFNVPHPLLAFLPANPSLDTINSHRITHAYILPHPLSPSLPHTSSQQTPANLKICLLHAFTHASRAQLEKNTQSCHTGLALNLGPQALREPSMLPTRTPYVQGHSLSHAPRQLFHTFSFLFTPPRPAHPASLWGDDLVSCNTENWCNWQNPHKLPLPTLPAHI